jgi:hypothetical protein
MCHVIINTANNPDSCFNILNFQDWCYRLYIKCSSEMQWLIIVLAYLGSKWTQFHASGWKCWCSTSFYLESCTWPETISWSIQQKNSECASDFVHPMQPSCPGLSLVKRARFTVMTLRQSNNSLNGKVRNNWDRWKAKSRACSFQDAF